MEKLRLLLLFTLRYEKDSLVFQLKDKLRAQGMDPDHLAFCDYLLEYSGSETRGSDVFNEKDLLGKGKKLFSSMFSEVQNVLLQHKPYITNIVDLMYKGKLPA